jgi:hypothetical protein
MASSGWTSYALAECDLGGILALRLHFPPMPIFNRMMPPASAWRHKQKAFAIGTDFWLHDATGASPLKEEHHEH